MTIYGLFLNQWQLVDVPSSMKIDGFWCINTKNNNSMNKIFVHSINLTLEIISDDHLCMSLKYLKKQTSLWQYYVHIYPYMYWCKLNYGKQALTKQDFLLMFYRQMTQLAEYVYVPWDTLFGLSSLMGQGFCVLRHVFLCENDGHYYALLYTSQRMRNYRGPLYNYHPCSTSNAWGPSTPLKA